MHNHTTLRRYQQYVSELDLITHEPTENMEYITNFPTIETKSELKDDYIIYIVISASVILLVCIIYLKYHDPRPCF